METIVIKGVNEKVYHEVLPNGLNIYFYPNTKVNKFYITLKTRYGSKQTEFKRKDEKEYHKIPNGVAHFLEHITFHLDGKEADDLFAPYGAYINAFTSYETTTYVVNNTRNFKECLDNLLYFVYTPYYTEETVEKEKGIIIEESKRGDDDPNRIFYRERNKSIFSKSNVREKVVGTPDEIKSITLDDINAAYNTFYHPGNMYLIIGGNFDIDEAMNTIKKRMDTFKFDEFKGIDVKLPDEPRKVNMKENIFPAKVNNCRISYTIKLSVDDIKKTGLSLKEFDNYMELLLTMNFGGTSEYFEKLIENKICSYGSAVGTDLIDNIFIINIVNSPIKGREKDFIKMTEEYLNNLSSDEESYKRKLKVLKANYILSFENPTKVVDRIGSDLIYFNEIITDTLEIGNNFTKEIGEKIIKSIDLNNKTITVMTPIDK